MPPPDRARVADIPEPWRTWLLTLVGYLRLGGVAEGNPVSVSAAAVRRCVTGGRQRRALIAVGDEWVTGATPSTVVLTLARLLGFLSYVRGAERGVRATVYRFEGFGGRAVEKVEAGDEVEAEVVELGARQRVVVAAGGGP